MRSSLVLLAVALTATCSLAQVTIATNNLANAGFTKHTVKNASGELFTLSVGSDASGNRPLLLHRSIDDGATWSLDPFTFNDATSGLSGSLLANNCSLAIDSAGILHAVWASYTYPSPYSQWYRNYDPLSGAFSSIVSIDAVTGASTGSRTAANQITVDQNDIVWIVAHGAASWVENLVRSDNPFATGETFTNLGAISMSGSAQSTALTVDVNNLVHCSYYRAIGPGEHWHRVYDPNNGWQPSTNIGNGSVAPHDYISRIVSDYLGFVHALVAVDSGTPASTWSFEYRRWDAVNGWTAPVVVFTATPAQYTGVANYQIFDLACEQSTGEVYAVYRDIAAGGMLRFANKKLLDTSFTVLSDLTPPTLGIHEYYLPSIRGSLFPSFNNLNGALDITYQYRMMSGTPPYSMLFDHVSVGGPTLTLSAPAFVGTTTTVDMSDINSASLTYVCGFSFLNTPGITLPDMRVIPINFDALFDLSQTPGNPFFTNTIGILNGAGAGSVGVSIPNVPAIAGVTFYAGAVSLSGGAPSGIATVFPSLTITLQ